MIRKNDVDPINVWKFTIKIGLDFHLRKLNVQRFGNEQSSKRLAHLRRSAKKFYDHCVLESTDLN